MVGQYTMRTPQWNLIFDLLKAFVYIDIKRWIQKEQLPLQVRNVFWVTILLGNMGFQFEKWTLFDDHNQI